MSSYLEALKPLRRAIILRFLEQLRDYTSNADILVTIINRTPDGVTAYYNDVIDDLRWLEARGYVRLTGESVVVVEATPAGLRIARGDNIDAGIARNLPEA